MTTQAEDDGVQTGRGKESEDWDFIEVDVVDRKDAPVSTLRLFLRGTIYRNKLTVRHRASTFLILQAS